MEVIKFSQLVKKSKKSKKNLLDLFQEQVNIKTYLDLSTKVTYKYMLSYEYIDKQNQINALEEIDESQREEGLLDKLLREQEADLTLKVLSLYCEGVEFSIEEDVDKKTEEYNTLLSSGIFDYVYAICQRDYDSFMAAIDRDIVSGLNTASTIVLKSLAKEFIKALDFDALKGLKEEMETIVTTPAYKDLEEIAQKIK